MRRCTGEGIGVYTLVFSFFFLIIQYLFFSRFNTSLCCTLRKHLACQNCLTVRLYIYFFHCSIGIDSSTLEDRDDVNLCNGVIKSGSVWK